MGQNRSSAVMQQRSEAHDSLDDFPTPPWATRAILEWLESNSWINPDQTVREPCANRGFMVRPLQEFFTSVEAADVHDYGFGYEQKDYLWGSAPSHVDWTFMNPPFRLAEQFIQRALATSECGVVCIVRSAFLEGQSRYETLFSKFPPACIVQHTERVPMVKGRYDPKVSSATAYSWLIWTPGSSGTVFDWIKPSRTRLERKDDAL